jgi:hypothetical protein
VLMPWSCERHADPACHSCQTGAERHPRTLTPWQGNELRLLARVDASFATRWNRRITISEAVAHVGPHVAEVRQFLN